MGGCCGEEIAEGITSFSSCLCLDLCLFLFCLFPSSFSWQFPLPAWGAIPPAWCQRCWRWRWTLPEHQQWWLQRQRRLRRARIGSMKLFIPVPGNSLRRLQALRRAMRSLDRPAIPGSVSSFSRQQPVRLHVEAHFPAERQASSAATQALR